MDRALRGDKERRARSQSVSSTQVWRHLLGLRYQTDAGRVVPLSLSLPHKGGGNAVAPLCLSATIHSRVYMCACPSAFAGTTSEMQFANNPLQPQIPVLADHVLAEAMALLARGEAKALRLIDVPRGREHAVRP